MILRLKKHRKMLVGVLGSLTVLLAAAVFIAEATEPYAVYADGTKVKDPCAVYVGSEEKFLVEDKETAEKIMEDVVREYTPEGAQIRSITIDRKITAKEKELPRGEEPESVLTAEDAEEYILAQNATDNPMFCMTISTESGSVKDVKAGVRYEEDKDEYKGVENVERKGKTGSKVVTDMVTSVNGKVTTSEEVDSTVIDDSRDKVISKGVKEKPADTEFQDYSGQTLGSGSGQTIANFARQFVGNPYVWGGTSLTNGADCSGFIYAVYNHFGIGVPRMGIYKAGRGVCLAEAKPGDVVYYPGHYAMYIGNGQIVHAYNSRAGICISGVHEPGTVLSVRRMVE